MNNVVAKACKGTKDPVVASIKVRKTTMKTFNQITTRVELGIAECKRALETIQDDYDSQDFMPKECE